jgi:hypothetical protein
VETVPAHLGRGAGQAGRLGYQCRSGKLGQVNRPADTDRRASRTCLCGQAAVAADQAGIASRRWHPGKPNGSAQFADSNNGSNRLGYQCLPVQLARLVGPDDPDR